MVVVQLATVAVVLAVEGQETVKVEGYVEVEDEDLGGVEKVWGAVAVGLEVVVVLVEHRLASQGGTRGAAETVVMVAVVQVAEETVVVATVEALWVAVGWDLVAVEVVAMVVVEMAMAVQVGAARGMVATAAVAQVAGVMVKAAHVAAVQVAVDEVAAVTEAAAAVASEGAVVALAGRLLAALEETSEVVAMAAVGTVAVVAVMVEKMEVAVTEGACVVVGGVDEWEVAGVQLRTH